MRKWSLNPVIKVAVQIITPPKHATGSNDYVIAVKRKIFISSIIVSPQQKLILVKLIKWQTHKIEFVIN